MTAAVTEPVTVESLEGGAVWRVVLGGQKGNILDGEAMRALQDVFRKAKDERPLVAVVLEGSGRHFSFGASVQEHLPGAVAEMLATFRETLLSLVDSDVTVLAAVRGQCLGGGLELVSCCSRIFAAPDAHLGQPEIALGVFAPVASVVLGDRIGQGHAEDLCLTGRVVGADDALRMGLVDVVADDPTRAALDWVREHLLSRSARSLRFAVRAVRGPLRKRLGEDLPLVEHLYLDELMQTADAKEGLNAFLEKRTPRWSHT